MEIISHENGKPAEKIKLLHRGVWANQLYPDQELPIGGSLFNSELNTKLELDFDFFDNQIKNFTSENLKTIYKQSEDSINDWLQKIGSDLNPYTYFICFQVQQKTDRLLQVDINNPTKSLERQKIYQSKITPKLSELVGKSECGERAALGQYLFQKIGVDSSYVSGITMEDVNDTDEYPQDHSFIILKNQDPDKSTLIFDIARPHHHHNLPRILKTNIPFTHQILPNKEELLIGATEVLQGGQLYFGVGDSIAGFHNTLP